MNWDRIVIDEIHTIRNPHSAGFQSCTQFRSRIRWGLTGTPVQNKSEDIVSLMKFLSGKKDFEMFKKFSILAVHKISSG